MLAISPDEFIPAREASRSLGKLIDKLEDGTLNKAVIVDRNKPRAVMVSFAKYEQIVSNPHGMVTTPKED